MQHVVGVSCNIVYVNFTLTCDQCRSSWKAHVSGPLYDCHRVELMYSLVRCLVNTHLCGEPCKLLGKQGCMEECTKVGASFLCKHGSNYTVFPRSLDTRKRIIPVPLLFIHAVK